MYVKYTRLTGFFWLEMKTDIGGLQILLKPKNQKKKILNSVFEVILKEKHDLIIL